MAAYYVRYVCPVRKRPREVIKHRKADAQSLFERVKEHDPAAEMGAYSS